MHNDHHISFGKQLRRALWGIFLAAGFGSFWVGLCMHAIALVIVGGGTLLIGLFRICESLSHLKRIPKPHSPRPVPHRAPHRGNAYRPRRY